MEKKLQTEIINWLRGTGCYVIKTKPGMGTPVGCPDVIFLCGNKWGVIEVKADEKSPYQPGQAYTLELLRKGNPFVYRADPSNWEKIKNELLTQFF